MESFGAARDVAVGLGVWLSFPGPGWGVKMKQ